jgi:hypothetical protein
VKVWNGPGTWHVDITPEPSPEERAAILLALEALVAQHQAQPQHRRSAWVVAGLRESLRGIDSGERSGWGRGLDRRSN